MSRVLPFEIGYASSMSDDEMRDLDTHLESMDFWRSDEQVRSLTERYMDHFYRRRDGGFGFPDPGMPVQFTAPLSFVEHPEGLTTTHRIISVRVPPGLTENTARLLVDMQLREQLFKDFEHDE